MSVFFFSWKTIFEKLAWYLLDTSSIASYLLSFLSFFLTQSRQHLDTWWIDRVSYLASGVFLPWQLLDTWSVDVAFSRHLLDNTSTPSRQHLDTSSIKNYWWSIYSPHAICRSFLSISLSIPLTFHVPNLSHSLQTSSLGTFKFFQVFLHLVSFWSPSFTCVSCFET